MGVKGAVAALGILVLAQAAQAEVSGPYISGGLMGIYQGERDVSGIAVGTLDQKLGYGISTSAGYQFQSGIRLEGEVAFRRNGTNDFNNANVGGSLNTVALMGNVLFEYDNDSGIYPYAGLGLGGARLQANDYTNIGGAVLDDDDSVFAYQAMAGVAFALDPNLSLIAEYKYFGTADADLRNGAGNRVGLDYSTHTGMLGLRYRFGSGPTSTVQRALNPQPAAMPVVQRVQPPRRIASPAPQPPQPAPLPVAQAKAAASLRRTYVIYFGLDRANLTPEAQQTVNEASITAKQDGTAVIELAGHTDRSGPAAYNLALSQRRAQNTATEIKRNGVTSRLLVKGFGETAPQVPTADGKYEPRNRRVEVVLQGQGDGVTQ